MIASNFRRYADALLHQLELPFDPLRTIQAMSKSAFAQLLRAAQRGMLEASNWVTTSKAKRARRPADTVIWTQTKLWLYTADQVELLLF